MEGRDYRMLDPRLLVAIASILVIIGVFLMAEDSPIALVFLFGAALTSAYSVVIRRGE